MLRFMNFVISDGKNVVKKTKDVDKDREKNIYYDLAFDILYDVNEVNFRPIKILFIQWVTFILIKNGS